MEMSRNKSTSNNSKRLNRLFFFGHHHGMWKFLGQGSTLSCDHLCLIFSGLCLVHLKDKPSHLAASPLPHPIKKHLGYF